MVVTLPHIEEDSIGGDSQSCEGPRGDPVVTVGEGTCHTLGDTDGAVHLQVLQVQSGGITVAELGGGGVAGRGWGGWGGDIRGREVKGGSDSSGGSSISIGGSSSSSSQWGENTTCLLTIYSKS